MDDMGKAKRASPTAAASDANDAQSQLSSESSQDQKTLVAIENDFINHSTGCTYSYNPVQAQAQVYASNVQVGCPPFVEYSHHHNRGGGPHNPCPWHNHPQSAVFAGHYGAPQLHPLQLQPQPWPQPQPQPQLPAMDRLGLDHSYSSGGGGGRSVDSIAVNLCPSASPGPSPIRCPPIKPWLQQRQRSRSALPPSLELNHQIQLQSGTSPSSSPPPPYLAPHGDYVPLLVSVHKLRHDEMLKAKIDNEDILIMMDYGGINNQTSTPNQSPRPPGTIADASAGQEDGTGTGSAAAAAARPKKDLFVFHVPTDMAGGEFYKLFSQFGKLRRARIQYDMIDGQKVSKGYGFVTFKRFSDAVVAVHSLNGYKVGEKNTKALVVTYGKDTPRPDPTNNSVSANNGTNGSSSVKRKARRVQRRLSN